MHRNPSQAAVKQSTVGLILAGGQGRRMSGADKGLLTLGGQTLVAQVAKRLAPQVSTIIISANRNLATYQKLGFTVVTDHGNSLDTSMNAGAQAYQGPIAGICATIEMLLEHPDAYESIHHLVCVPCDVPSLPLDLVTRLASAITHNSSASVAHDGKQQQNLHCLIQRSAWSSLQEFYSKGGRAIKDWYPRVNAQQVDYSDMADAFKNFNAPIDSLPSTS